MATDFDFIAYVSKMAFFWKLFSRQWRFWNMIVLYMIRNTKRRLFSYSLSQTNLTISPSLSLNFSDAFSLFGEKMFFESDMAPSALQRQNHIKRQPQVCRKCLGPNNKKQHLGVHNYAMFVAPPTNVTAFPAEKLT